MWNRFHTVRDTDQKASGKRRDGQRAHDLWFGLYAPCCGQPAGAIMRSDVTVTSLSLARTLSSAWMQRGLRVLLAGSLAACGGDSLIAQPKEPASLVAPTSEWKLTFADEFEGARGTPPSAEKWRAEVGTDWGNQQLEYDTDRTENVALDGDGHLTITARRESYRGQSFTSGRLSTEGLFAQTYGRFEARMKMPRGAGLWPAFWLLGADVQSAGWPECGEIDILELRGQTPDEVRSTLHAPGYSGGESLGLDVTLERDLSQDFHRYSAEWTRDGFAFYVDDLRTFRVLRSELSPAAAWPFDRPFFVILNLAVGGNYVGPPDDSTPFPQSLVVDYVRIYELVES